MNENTGEFKYDSNHFISCAISDDSILNVSINNWMNSRRMEPNFNCLDDKKDYNERMNNWNTWIVVRISWSDKPVLVKRRSLQTASLTTKIEVFSSKSKG